MTHRISASMSMMFREWPLLDRFAAASDAGFDGFEIQQIDEGDPVAMARAAQATGKPVVLVNFPLGDLMQGGPGLSGVPGREAVFAAEAERGLIAAGELGARFIHIGPSRIPADSNREACLAAYRRNVDAALGILERLGHDGVLLIEQMNAVDVPDALFAAIDDAADMVRTIGSDRFRLLFDLYHVAKSGEAIAPAWVRHGSIAPHLQFSDTPSRTEPGTGTAGIADAVSAIFRHGYSGWLGAEYRPAGETMAGLGWLDAMRAAEPGTDRQP